MEANRQRDLQHQWKLRDLGWRVLVVWECEMKDVERVSEIVRDFLREKEGGRNEIG